MNYDRTIVLACATVIEEMLPLMPEGMHHKVLDFGLHVQPNKLRDALQNEINLIEKDYDTILLGYGLCSQAVIGVKSENCSLVCPRVDDCIAIFLGGKSEYLEQQRCEPGSYYLTKGWIEVGSTPFTEYDQMVERLGPEKAARVQKMMLGNYKRLALINTGQNNMEHYRDYSRQTAERFNLRYEEIEGSRTMVQKLISGNWNEEFIVTQPGQPITFQHFFPG
jgi:hypothetical protein